MTGVQTCALPIFTCAGKGTVTGPTNRPQNATDFDLTITMDDPADNMPPKTFPVVIRAVSPGFGFHYHGVFRLKDPAQVGFSVHDPGV